MWSRYIVPSYGQYPHILSQYTVQAGLQKVVQLLFNELLRVHYGKMFGLDRTLAFALCKQISD